MKKLMIVAAAALCATVGFSEGIESENIVGYDTQSIQGGKLTCASFQFVDIASPEQATLANVSTEGLTPSLWEVMQDEAPCIMIYNGVGYDFYYYISDAGDNYDETGWADADGNLAGSVGIPSTGFWLEIPVDKCTSGSLTEAGQVLAADTATVDIAAGLTLAGNPFPVALDLSKVVTTGLTPSLWEVMQEEAPCLMIYNGIGYDFYYYISDAGDNYDETGWADGDGNLVTIVAPAGAGFWIDSPTAGTLTFSL